MAGKHFPFSSNPRSQFSSSSSRLITILSLLALISFSLFFFLFSSSHSATSCITTQTTAALSLNPNPKSSSPPPEYSFVASLEKFLTSRSRSRSSLTPSAARTPLRRSISKTEDPFDLSVVRVYVYDMPDKFTYDLLWLFRSTYKETVNLTSNGSPDRAGPWLEEEKRPKTPTYLRIF